MNVIAAQAANRFGQCINMFFVMTLECDRDFEHARLQEAAFGAELVGCDGLMFCRNRGVEDANILLNCVIGRAGRQCG